MLPPVSGLQPSFLRDPLLGRGMSWSPSTARWQPATGVWRRWKTAPLLATDYSILPDNATPPLNGVDPRLTCIHRRRRFFASKWLGSPAGFGTGNGSGRGGAASQSRGTP